MAAYTAAGSLECWGSGFFAILTDTAAGNVTDPLYLDGILSREKFLMRLGFEKSRVDRSGNPLSLALFFLQEDLIRDSRKLRKYLIAIQRATRETDLKGWVRRAILGLLLLDTDGPGARRCVEMLVNGRSEVVGDVLTRTYPDRIFEAILETAGSRSGFRSGPAHAIRSG